MEIRSYRRVFDLERRIYRVDRLRLNPGGIPVRGVVYFLAILAVALIVGRLPLLAVAIHALPWYVRDLALPGASAVVLTAIRIEGRPFHLAAHVLVRYRCGARRLAGLRPCRASSCSIPGARWHPPEILMLPDGSDPRMRHLRYTGPGAVLVTVAHERDLKSSRVLELLGRRPRLIVRQRSGARAPAAGQVIVLQRAARLRVR
jgi:hypothetical protein